MEKIISNIIKNLSNNQNYTVGIDGGTGAGKTTIVEKLKMLLERDGYRVFVLHIDDFIHRRNIRYDDCKDEWYCYYYLQWRYDYLIKEILEPLKRNEEIDKLIEVYDKKNDKYTQEQIYIKPGTIILLEGVFLQRKEIKDFFDFIVYIDVERSERLSRVLKRDTYIGNDYEIKNKYENRYFIAEDYYMDKCKPIENADMVYRNWF